MGRSNIATVYVNAKVVSQIMRIRQEHFKSMRNALKEVMKRPRDSDCPSNPEKTRRKNQNNSWCGRRDLNPGRQRGRLMS